MARKKAVVTPKDDGESTGLREGTIQAILAVVSTVVAIFLILAAFNKAGIVGENVYFFLKQLLGVGYFLLPVFFIVLVVLFIQNIRKHFQTLKIISSVLSLVAALGLVDLMARDQGGYVGHYITAPLLALFEFYVSLSILLAVFLITLIVIFDADLNTHLSRLWAFITRRKEKNIDTSDIDKMEIAGGTTEDEVGDDDSKKNGKDDFEESEGVPQKNIPTKPSRLKEVLGLRPSESAEELLIPQKQQYLGNEEYIPIPISLLEHDRGKPGVGDIKANANIIKRTLQNFGIHVEMDEVSIGPSVTRYALKPAEGVKLARIVGLQNDLSLALAAHPIRIEAPIPGKSLVGIEIPNTTKTTVGLATLLGSDEFQNSDKPLLVSLGKSITGKSHFANLAKMPHVLIAGATGSGKSVTIHTIITSLLYRNAPHALKFIMIDPKRVELTLYNKIPHLLTPVITEAKKAILALKWAAKEMDRRYDLLEQNSVRDIESYHKTILQPALKELEDMTEDEKAEVKLPETMPYIVIVIDELADIMQTYPRELESAIVRLAQMSRAVGIHLMLSTQRPSVNVITGLIKANVPARVALQVASQIDSRTILDAAGAEKLLGAGDMLYLGSEMAKPIRLQSAYITEPELKKVVKFLAENYEHHMPSDINLTGENQKNSIFEATMDDASLEDDDELYEEARRTVIEAGKASTSYIQRKLRVGYARAARLMDILEERGVIGPADGSKPRDVIDNDMQAAQEEENPNPDQPAQ